MAFDPYRHIDDYCERVDAAFWGEPLNALTNAAFLIAAWVCWRAARRAGGPDWASGLLIGLMATIGVGSFLFHTLANGWSLWADVIPIQLAIVSYFYIIGVRFYGLPRWGAGALTAGALAAIFALGTALTAALGPMNGSSGYLAVALVILALAAGLALRGHPAGGAIAAGMGIFAVSLTLRTMDMAWCEALPIGTHFMWHVLNGVTLGWLTLAVIRHGGGARRAAEAGR
ncbi:ceramidase domain-containing protein [Oceanicella actignis]|uniref:ceramidase domain-containing protein n=1 Tax=Oceanicella actignis TaxID=1189325 RepID=UPI0011E7ACCB|nr:ceramidase domain-containing protein [Oceanicella actignis]TYO88434.1 ceramidase [Oceanicella actignis]